MKIIILGVQMENTYYKCPKCGFVYQVPSYWSGFAPEDKIEMFHMNLETKEMCDENTLDLIKD